MLIEFGKLFQQIHARYKKDPFFTLIKYSKPFIFVLRQKLHDLVLGFVLALQVWKLFCVQQRRS